MTLLTKLCYSFTISNLRKKKTSLQSSYYSFRHDTKKQYAQVYTHVTVLRNRFIFK